MNIQNVLRMVQKKICLRILCPEGKEVLHKNLRFCKQPGLKTDIEKMKTWLSELTAGVECKFCPQKTSRVSSAKFYLL